LRGTGPSDASLPQSRRQLADTSTVILIVLAEQADEVALLTAISVVPPIEIQALGSAAGTISGSRWTSLRN
jgi:hypothetical protein